MSAKSIADDYDRVRVVLPGFPRDEPFATPGAAMAYLRQPRIQCLRCGKLYRALGNHLSVHGWTAYRYKIHYHLPLSPANGLTCTGSRRLNSDSAKARGLAALGRASHTGRARVMRGSTFTRFPKQTCHDCPKPIQTRSPRFVGEVRRCRECSLRYRRQDLPMEKGTRHVSE